ncbi:three-Cys-motif partner protein TcmP [Rhodopirellula sp. MGV]|uniref:three-Cys-motif partner protein TcmP n=1 Tax=Rhodopirellula sp. MGV TaxID=2023130 RepID=UPI000B95F51B|nr:three-Cys-motif partner protein TcmP [Rhodopirellula sp. MGV]OYP34506.1 hypothetical protein CGZ80_14635 [Rhodopirellula sp. MGV]PNY36900.1 hypothetical protein C2E31_10600 [Rhodopirellula baltica]PNY37240.1 hypothetical protein C2E31_08755 [Rhodopirellula baltica]
MPNEQKSLLLGGDADASQVKKKTKTKKELYEWSIGKEPPLLGLHSISKHEVLEAYIKKYVSILTKNKCADQLMLSLVDGFAGGGVYTHPETQQRIPGSPILMLNAIAEAEVEANLGRRKPFRVNGQFYFVERSASTIEHLKKEVSNAPSSANRMENIHFIAGNFTENLDKIIAKIKSRGKAHRAIFLLDQYGYTAVPMADIRRIFYELPRAEVILTIAVDWLTHFVNESESFKRALKRLELERYQDLFVRIREDHGRDWRAEIQHILHGHFHQSSGAECYTPFFVNSVDSNRAYWLLHFSKHSTARDAMMELHWDLNNHFEHFGKAGFGMLCLGFDPRQVPLQNQPTFAFDKDARELTREALLIEIPEKLSEFGGSTPYQMFFDRNVNDTPATKAMISDAIRQLAKDKDIEIFSENGKQRACDVKLNDTDRIRLAQTETFLLRNIKD